MLKQIKLVNFQGHRHLTIDVDEQVTYIVGKSDAGKSSIVRALAWLCLGVPSGAKFIQRGRPGCRVELIFDGGLRIVKTRGRTKPTVYKINDKVFKASGNSVPAEVTQLLSVSDVNFQGQLDQVFWILDNPGQVAKNLNAIVDLQDVDKSMLWVQSKLRSARAAVAVAEDKITHLKESIESLSWVPEFEASLAAASKLRDLLQAAQKQRISLSHCVGKANAHLTHRIAMQEFVKGGQRVLRRANSAAELGDRIEALSTLIDKAKDQHRKQIPAPSPAEMENIESRILKLESLKSKTKRLRSLLSKIQAGRKLSADQRTIAATAGKTLRKLTSGKKCPLCGQKITRSQS